MILKKRLAAQGALLLAASTLAVATVRQARHEVQTTPPEQSARQPLSKAAGHTNKSPERRPQADSVPRQHLTVSPDRTRAVYHLPFDPYGVSPEPLMFVAVDNESGKTIAKIQVLWPARYVQSVEWLSDRTVVARGEARYLAVIDVEAGEQTHNLIGSDFAPSPDGTQIVYSHNFNPRYGETPPEYQNDYVLFTLIGRRPESGRVSSRYDSTNYRVIYPTPLPWGASARNAIESPADRHQIKIPLAWSPDSRKVAFVESHAKKLWLVVIEPTGDNNVATNSRRFELGDLTSNISSLSWEPDGSRVVVVGGRTSLPVDIK